MLFLTSLKENFLSEYYIQNNQFSKILYQNQSTHICLISSYFLQWNKYFSQAPAPIFAERSTHNRLSVGGSALEFVWVHYPQLRYSVLKTATVSMWSPQVP